MCEAITEGANKHNQVNKVAVLLYDWYVYHIFVKRLCKPSKQAEDAAVRAGISHAHGRAVSKKESSSIPCACLLHYFIRCEGFYLCSTFFGMQYTVPGSEKSKP